VRLCLRGCSSLPDTSLQLGDIWDWTGKKGWVDKFEKKKQPLTIWTARQHILRVTEQVKHKRREGMAQMCRTEAKKEKN